MPGNSQPIGWEEQTIFHGLEKFSRSTERGIWLKKPLDRKFLECLHPVGYRMICIQGR